MNNQQSLEAWFANFNHRMNTEVPNIVAETATEYFKDSFITTSWDGVPWAETKKPVRRGKLMVRSAALMGSIAPSLVSADRVTIKAGGLKVPYAQVHNEGGLITRRPRSETFQRKRYTSGKNKGRFKGGTTSGKGFTFKVTSYNMTKRQFMGHSPNLNQEIIKRLTAKFK
jgi:phage gpG-like protein